VGGIDVSHQQFTSYLNYSYFLSCTQMNFYSPNSELFSVPIKYGEINYYLYGVVFLILINKYKAFYYKEDYVLELPAFFYLPYSKAKKKKDFKSLIYPYDPD